jgi:hypothetical protein
MDKRRNSGPNGIAMDLKYTLLYWRRFDEILIRTLKMCTEVGASFGLVRLHASRAEIVSHAPQDVQTSNIEHSGIIGYVKIGKEVLCRG